MQQIACPTVLRRPIAVMLAVLLAAGMTGCGVISSQSVYEGVRSTEKARAVVTDKSRSELPPYDQYQKERAGEDK